MKKNLQRAVSALLLIILLVSASLPVCAAPSQYSSTSNSGQRDEICTTLDGTGADDYYTGNYEYDKLDDLSSATLLTTLRKLMTDTHDYISSYTDCKNYSDKTDCEKNNGRVTLIYTSYSATMSQWNGWNREHVWPQSLGGGNTSGGGADLHHIRPSDGTVNSTRSNKKYGYADGGKAVYGSNPATNYLGGYSGTYFEPLDNVKGDVARIVLYVYVRWGTAWGADSVTEVFQSVDVLLEWCALDPVDTWEMGRNEVVEGIQGNRNVFIDYPELAWLLFDREIPENMITPSGEAKDGSSEGGNNGGSTQDPTDPPEVTPPTEDPVLPPEIPPVVEPEEDASLAIVSNNAYFSEKLHLMYAVRAEDLTAGQTLSVILCDQNGEQIATTYARGTATINGETLSVFVSDKGIPVQNIDTVIYAKVQIHENGDVVAQSDLYGYSLLEYLYERLYVSTGVTDAQRALYNALIKYAKSTDQVLNGDDSIAQLSYVRINGDGGMYPIGDLVYPETNLIPGSGERIVWTVQTPGSSVQVDVSEMENGHSVVAGYNIITSSLVSAPTFATYYCDFSGFSSSTPTSYTSRTSTSGWRASYAAYTEIIGGTHNVILNGKKGNIGSITSPTLTTGIQSFTFQYGNPYSETNGVDVTINVYQNGKVVATTRLDNNSVTQNKAYTFEWTLDSVITGEFSIEIVNNAPSNSTSNKDRVAIWDISWVGFAA